VRVAFLKTSTSEYYPRLFHMKLSIVVYSLLVPNRYRPGQSIGFHTDRVEKLDDMVWSVVVDSGGPRDGLHFQFPLEKPAGDAAAASANNTPPSTDASTSSVSNAPADATKGSTSDRGQASSECRVGIAERPGLVSVQTGCARSVLKHGVLSVERERISVTWRFFRPGYLRTTEGWYPAPQRLARFVHEVMIREQRYALERERGSRPPLPPRKAQTTIEGAAAAAAASKAAAASSASASTVTANSAAPVASAAAVLDADVAAADALPAATSAPTQIPPATPPGHQGAMRALLVGTERPAVATFSRAEGAALLADFRRLTEEAASAQHVLKDLPRLDQPPPGPPLLGSKTEALPVATPSRVESVNAAPRPPPRPPLDTEALFKDSATTPPLVGASPLLPPPPSAPLQAEQLPPPVTVGVICSGMGGVVGRSSVDKWARVGAAAENALDSSDLTGLLCGALGEAFAKSAAANAVPGWPRGFRVCVCDLFAGDPKTMYLREGLRKFGGPPLAVLPVELPSHTAAAPAGAATNDESFNGPAGAAPAEMACFGMAADLYVLLEGGFRAADVANSVLERGEAPLLRVACTGGAAAGWVGSLATQNLPIMLLDTTTEDPKARSASLDGSSTDNNSSSDSSLRSSNNSSSSSSNLRGSVGWSSGGSSEALLLATPASSSGSTGVGEGTATSTTTACLTVAEQRELSLEKQAQEVARDLALLRAARLARPEERAAVADAVVRLVRAHNTASLSRKRALPQAAVAAVGGLESTQQAAALGMSASNWAGKGKGESSSSSNNGGSHASLAPGAGSRVLAGSRSAGTTRGELARPPSTQRAWHQDWSKGGGPIGASKGEYADASTMHRQVQPPHHSTRSRGQHLASSSSFRVPPGRSSGLGPNPAEDAEVPPLGAMRALLLGSSSSRPAGATFSRAEGAALYSDWRRLRDAERAGSSSSALQHPQGEALGYQAAAPSPFLGNNGNHDSSSSNSSSGGSSSGSYGDAAAWEGFDRMFFGNLAPPSHSAKMP
jgi:hypothetical protein